jgi:O-antigen/teichoic acid export membrane protein
MVNLGTKFFGFGIAFLSSAYSAQQYGPSLFGFVILSVFAQYILCEITDLGFSTHLAREIAQKNLPLRTWLQHIPRILFRSLVGMGMWIFGVSIFSNENLEIHLLLCLNIPFWLCNSYFQQIAYAKGKVYLANLETFMQNGLLVSIYPLSIFTSHFYEMGIIISSFLSCIFSITVSIYSKDKNCAINVSRFPSLENKILDIKGIRLAPSRILGIATYLDSLVMGLLFGPATAGFYAIASRLRTVMPVGLISISDTTYSRAISTKQISSILYSVENKIIFALTTIVATILLIYTSPFILHIYGSAFLQSAIFFKYFIMISFAIGIVYILRNLLIAWNQDNYVRNCVYVSTCIQIGFSVVLYFFLPIYSIVIALLLSNLFLILAFAKKVYSVNKS